MKEFKMNTYAYKTITADGYISSYSGKFEVNHSSILTRLIQEAGRYCERFASDLFIDWQSVLRYIDEAEESPAEEKTFLFGFRQDGVDGNSFIESRFTSGAYAYPEKEYRSLWRLDIQIIADTMSMTLGRVF